MQCIKALLEAILQNGKKSMGTSWIVMMQGIQRCWSAMMDGVETEKIIGALYPWSMAVYCVGEVGMVRHDSWMTLRAFEESLFSITQEMLISLAP